MLNVTALRTAFGNKYNAGSQGMKDLIQQVYMPANTSEAFVCVPTDKTTVEAATVLQDEVLQGFQQAWTPMGDTSFTPVDIPLFALKVDLDINPATIVDTWLGFLASNKLDYKEWPLSKYIAEILVVQKAKEDYEKKGIFWGKKLPIVNGTALPIKDAMNGIRYLQNKAVADSKAAAIQVGAVPTDPVLFVEYIEAMVFGIPEWDRQLLQSINMAPALRDRYKRGMRKKYNQNYNQADIAVVADAENVKIMGRNSHIGSGRIWCTVPGNAMEFTKKAGNESQLKLEESKRTVSVMTDFHKGIGFWDWNRVYFNDVELAAL